MNGAYHERVIARRRLSARAEGTEDEAILAVNDEGEIDWSQCFPAPSLIVQAIAPCVRVKYYHSDGLLEKIYFCKAREPL